MITFYFYLHLMCKKIKMRSITACFIRALKIKNGLFLVFFLFPFIGNSQSNNQAHDTLKIINLITDIERLYNESKHTFVVDSVELKKQAELKKLTYKLQEETDYNVQKYVVLGKAYLEYFELLSEFRTLSVQNDFLYKIDELIGFSKEKKINNLLAKLYLFKAQYYSKFKNDFQKAITNNQLSVDFALKSTDTLTLISAYNGIALNYSELGLNDKAIEFFHTTLKLQKDPLQQYTTRITMGDLYRLMDQYDKSINCLEQAENILFQNDFDLSYKTNLHLKFATVYTAKKDFDKALEHILQAEQLDSPMFIGRIYYTKGLVYYGQHNFKSAILEFEKSLDFQKKNKFSNRNIQLFTSLGNAYYLLDSIQSLSSSSIETFESINFDHRNLLQTSKSYFLDSYDLLHTTQSKKNKREVFKALKKIYLKENNYKKAFEMLELERTMTDSINNFETKARFIERELRYEYELKREADSLLLVNEKILNQAQITQKKAENKILYLSVLALALVLVLAFFRFKYQQKKKQIKIEKQNSLIESKQKEIISTELEFLKAQINPHFLFNVINNIYFKINKGDEEAREALLGFSDILRYQLYECNQPLVPIEKEIKYLKEYIRLQLMRKPKNTQLQLDINENVSGFEISPLLLIPFIENAFKYLSNYKDTSNTISISLNKNIDLFIFTVTNTYMPTPNKNQEENLGGIGIENVQRRLHLLYPEKHRLEIDKTETHFTVILTLNLQQNGN